MNHPTSELIDLVDGALEPAARERVEAHVRACPVCGPEVGRARAARDALRGLADVDPPPGLIESILDAAETGSAGAPRGRARTWSRWAAGAGVAAAIVLGLAIAFPQVRGSNGANTEAAGAEDQSKELSAATTVEVVGGDLGTDDLGALATGAREAVDVGAPSPAYAAQDGVPVVAEVRAEPRVVDRALACLTTAFGTPDGTVVRLLEGRYEGSPAVLGVVVSGPGAGEPPDRAEVLVADSRDCSILVGTTVQF